MDCPLKLFAFWNKFSILQKKKKSTILIGLVDFLKMKSLLVLTKVCSEEVAFLPTKYFLCEMSL